MKKTKLELTKVTKTTVTLPVALINETNKIEFKSGLWSDRAFLLLEYLFNLNMNEIVGMDEYTAMTNSFIQELLGTINNTKLYKFVLNPLLDNNIIEKNNSYKVGEYGYGMGYRINNDILLSSTKVDRQHLKYEYTYDYDKHTLEVLNEIVVDENEKFGAINSILDKKKDSFRIITHRTPKIKISNALPDKDINDYEYIIEFNKKYYQTTDPDKELQNLLKRTELHINCLYDKIEHKDFFAKRNTTNNRLDSNVTNMYSEIWDSLLLDNEKLVEIDIANSQPAFLSYLIRKKNINVEEEFLLAAENGKYYELLMDILECDRDKAKKVNMVLFFGGEWYDSKEKRILKQRLPKLISFIDEFKKENGYKNFSIGLQKEESKMMIDRVYGHLIFNNISCLTVHDSIRCKESDTDKVFELMNEVFDHFDFKCHLRTKAQKPTLNASKKEIDTNTLKTKESPLNEPEIASNEVSDNKPLFDIEEIEKRDHLLELEKQITESIRNKYGYAISSNASIRKNMKILAHLFNDKIIKQGDDLFEWIKLINEEKDKNNKKKIVWI